ncbi:replication-relaxation family protein [Plantactinospora siamensis]|uniref:Replication-relaxation family protein n=1 Tax=Plantactinospora siamensis TaxID=555372 RepID=A0ABV6P1I3_9ACTN
MANTTDQVLRVQHQLTERDWRLLDWLYDHSVLTSFQIAHALFPSRNYAQRRLTQLTGLGLLERFRPFRLQGGTYPYHYALAHLGELIIAAARGDNPPRRTATAARLHRIATNRNIEHRLGINQFFTDLAGHERLHPGSRLHHWWPDTSLRKFFSPPGTTAYGSVNADGLGVWSENDRTVAWYLEHDTGTESLGVLVDKLASYGQLAWRGGPRWPVLFWLHSTAREANLHRRLIDAKPTVPVATAARDRLEGRSPAEAVWHLHRSRCALLRLADLPMPGPVDPADFARTGSARLS